VNVEAFGWVEHPIACMSYLKRAEKRGQRFLNPVPTTTGGFKTPLKALPRFISNREERVPRVAVGPFRTDAAVYATAPESGLRVTWFGHSSVLLEIDGMRVLIDPIWEERASPLQWMGPKRFFAPTMRLEDLPPLDVILVSHDHYDHMGSHTLRALLSTEAAENAQWVTALGVGRRLRKLGVPGGRIQELDWTESTVVGRGVTVTAWPARHFSGRGIFDRYKTLWSSYVIEGARHRVYFGADSGWWDGFAEIAAQYDGFDLTLLEIGAFDALWAGIHLGPDCAAEAFKAMGGAERAGLLMPIHWGLFSLGMHAWRQPMERLTAVGGGIPLWSPEPGVPTEIEGPWVADWWRR
jgi:L-ascorbate metabolism protein UlaG (beta-lactamase superfamily)